MKTYSFPFAMLSLLLFIHSLSAATKDNSTGYQFNIREKQWLFSTEYMMDSNGAYLGKVVKNALQFPTQYELIDRSGHVQAKAVYRILNLSLLYTWASEIDVYDKEGRSIGYIDGQVGTFQTARFSIYCHGVLKAIAYLDKQCSGFSIVDAENESKVIATLSRHFVKDATDHWSVYVYDKAAVLPEVIKVFAAFAVDTQNEFKEDT